MTGPLFGHCELKAIAIVSNTLFLINDEENCCETNDRLKSYYIEKSYILNRVFKLCFYFTPRRFDITNLIVTF